MKRPGYEITIATVRLLTCSLLGLFIVAFFPLFASADPATAPTYVRLVNIPGLPNTGNVGLPAFLNALYIVIISAAALFAVIKIAIAGVKYTMTDVVPQMSDAKKDIYGALLGLAILLIPFIVLKEINPDLVSLNVLGSATPTNVPPPSPPSPTQAPDPNAPGVNNDPYQTSELVKNCGQTIRVENGKACCSNPNYKDPAQVCASVGGPAPAMTIDQCPENMKRYVTEGQSVTQCCVDTSFTGPLKC